MRHAGNDEFLLREGSAVRCVAIHGATAEYTEARQRAPVIEPAPDTALGRVLKTKQVIQIADTESAGNGTFGKGGTLNGHPTRLPMSPLWVKSRHRIDAR